MVKIKPMTVKHLANPITVERFDKTHNVRTFQNPTTVQRSGWVLGFNFVYFRFFQNQKSLQKPITWKRFGAWLKLAVD